MKLSALYFAGIAAAIYSLPASAHHSFAMFDADKKMTVTGTVKEFQWTNPHSWIIMEVPVAGGKSEEWKFEMGGPAALTKIGWQRGTVKPGDKITAMFHPLRDGHHGGQYMQVTLADGKKLGSDTARYDDGGGQLNRRGDRDAN